MFYLWWSAVKIGLVLHFKIYHKILFYQNAPLYQQHLSYFNVVLKGIVTKRKHFLKSLVSFLKQSLKCKPLTRSCKNCLGESGYLIHRIDYNSFSNAIVSCQADSSSGTSQNAHDRFNCLNPCLVNFSDAFVGSEIVCTLPLNPVQYVISLLKNLSWSFLVFRVLMVFCASGLPDRGIEEQCFTESFCRFTLYSKIISFDLFQLN